MGLSTGTQLGPYEILSAIGAGGMGEVYRAQDTRLDRIVAIKILPAHLADRAELRERFEREARTIASLNHPHICTLYDVGHQDGIDYLVMEYRGRRDAGRSGWRKVRCRSIRCCSTPSRLPTRSTRRTARA